MSPPGRRLASPPLTAAQASLTIVQLLILKLAFQVIFLTENSMDGDLEKALSLEKDIILVSEISNAEDGRVGNESGTAGAW